MVNESLVSDLLFGTESCCWWNLIKSGAGGNLLSGSASLSDLRGNDMSTRCSNSLAQVGGGGGCSHCTVLIGFSSISNLERASAALLLWLGWNALVGKLLCHQGFGASGVICTHSFQTNLS